MMRTLPASTLKPQKNSANCSQSTESTRILQAASFTRKTPMLTKIFPCSLKTGKSRKSIMPWCSVIPCGKAKKWIQSFWLTETPATARCSIKNTEKSPSQTSKIWGIAVLTHGLRPAPTQAAPTKSAPTCSLWGFPSSATLFTQATSTRFFFLKSKNAGTATKARNALF